jgi:hypothetical protein
MDDLIEQSPGGTCAGCVEPSDVTGVTRNSLTYTDTAGFEATSAVAIEMESIALRVADPGESVAFVLTVDVRVYLYPERSQSLQSPIEIGNAEGGSETVLIGSDRLDQGCREQARFAPLAPNMQERSSSSEVMIGKPRVSLYHCTAAAQLRTRIVTRSRGPRPALSQP